MDEEFKVEFEREKERLRSFGWKDLCEIEFEALHYARANLTDRKGLQATVAQALHKSGLPWRPANMLSRNGIENKEQFLYFITHATRWHSCRQGLYGRLLKFRGLGPKSIAELAEWARVKIENPPLVPKPPRLSKTQNTTWKLVKTETLEALIRDKKRLDKLSECRELIRSEYPNTWRINGRTCLGHLRTAVDELIEKPCL
jgi:hypothetical protein